MSSEMMERAKRLVARPAVVELIIRPVVDLFVELAASGHGDEALRMLERSPSAHVVEPLIVAMKRHCGQRVIVNPVISDVADDVLKDIRQAEDAMQQDT